MENNDSTSRRTFIAGSILAGLAVGCSNKKDPFTQSAEETVAASGEKVKLLSVDGEIVEVDIAYLKPIPHLPPVSIDESRIGIEGKKFVMVVDLARCKNLRKCQASCDHMHHIHSEQNWLKVYPMKEAEHTAPYWQPTQCMHCDEPPCVKVCPVDATFKRKDGIVLIDNQRCIGCRFCMAACPYSSRVFNWQESDYVEDPNIHVAYSPETSVPQKRGTVGKCDFCPDMYREGKLPHCVQACPNGVFLFGDMNEDSVTNGAETFRFSELIKDKAGYRLMEDLGTKPSVYYLPPVSRNFKFEDGMENEAPGETISSHTK
ncbi:MAG: 4Fe-4S dicluster domain-containing protein [Bacteroidetes bacterium]|jgi:molybdopterin-containing oxidoreductase family iron-sulfur binding subunit|nr:4Fe-4S dicluster domain-containing protein [Bacteroidota bacterium]